jgi:1-acyl-sn-glycerol-3-phosphate acyltransferase
MSAAIFALIGRIIRAFYVRTRIPGIQQALKRTCSICVANHLGSFGPLAVMSTLFGRLHPWVIAEVTDLKKCAAYLRKDFVEKELKLRSLLAREVSTIIGRICVSLMRCLQAIPVYRQGGKMIRTFELSIAYLRQGRPLLIFPESDESKERSDVCSINTGFIRVAKSLYDHTRDIAVFYPIAINKNVRGARVGPPIRFNPDVPFGEERVRIKQELERSITEMYLSMERERRRGPRPRHAGKLRKSTEGRKLVA